MADSQVTLRRHEERDYDLEPLEHAHTEECCTCQRTFVFDSNRNLWFKEEDFEMYGFRWLAYDAATPALKTQRGWCCSITCWNDFAESEDDLILPGKVYLVRPA